MRTAHAAHGALSPLLSPDEAVALVRKGTRGVGVASHGWLSAGSPDPAGARALTTSRRRAW